MRNQFDLEILAFATILLCIGIVGVCAVGAIWFLAWLFPESKRLQKLGHQLDEILA